MNNTSLLQERFDDRPLEEDERYHYDELREGIVDAQQKSNIIYIIVDDCHAMAVSVLDSPDEVLHMAYDSSKYGYEGMELDFYLTEEDELVRTLDDAMDHIRVNMLFAEHMVESIESVSQLAELTRSYGLSRNYEEVCMQFLQRLQKCINPRRSGEKERILALVEPLLNTGEFAYVSDATKECLQEAGWLDEEIATYKDRNTFQHRAEFLGGFHDITGVHPHTVRTWFDMKRILEESESIEERMQIAWLYFEACKLDYIDMSIQERIIPGMIHALPHGGLLYFLQQYCAHMRMEGE